MEGDVVGDAALSCVTMGMERPFRMKKNVSKLGFMWWYLFLYFVCDIGVLETRSVDHHLLFNEGGGLFSIVFAANTLSIDRVCPC